MLGWCYMSSQTKFSGHVYARFLFVCSIRNGGPAPQVQNLSWAIVLFMKQVPHQICELDMQTSHHPFIHGLRSHDKEAIIIRKVLMVFLMKTRSMGPLGLGRSPAFKGGSPSVTHV